MARITVLTSRLLICATFAWALQSSQPRIRTRADDLLVRTFATAGDGDASSPSDSARRVDLCIIGGGISGLAAACTAAGKPDQTQPSILLLEADSCVGGRVRSDYTDDRFILDRGFAVFIEEYPQSKALLSYDALGLKQFLPGAKVKLLGRDKLATVADPLRRRRDILTAITSPVGTLRDKLRLVPLFYTVMSKSIDELFAMEETDTLTCLRDKYSFDDEFISSFFSPFLEGIYLAPLEHQSSRMFHFVMKMFTVGLTSLPSGGMQAVANQLEDKAVGLGVDIELASAVLSIQQPESDGGFVVEVKSDENGDHLVHAKYIALATDFDVARILLQDMMRTRLDEPLKQLPQRSVACMYFGLPSPAPIVDPILILNGEGSGRRNTRGYPINNVCFPSVVQKCYAPEGHELCSVSILENALSEYAGDYASLEADVREQLCTWFPDYRADINDQSKWTKKALYIIPNAQPAHYGKGEDCANTNGGRDCTTFQGKEMPMGVFVCGDHMATSTLNGALESGVNAGLKFLELNGT